MVKMYLHAVLHDSSETFEPKMNEHVILGNDLSAGPREIQSKRHLRTT